MKRWFVPTTLKRGYSQAVVDRVWFVLESFASFGFCKAHAAAFALPTYQSAWLKRHYPAHFLAGVLAHDPGMYPKRLILEEARRCGITIMGLDVNVSDEAYRVEKLAVTRAQQAPRGAESDVISRPICPRPTCRPAASGSPPATDCRTDAATASRLSLADVKGITEAEIARIVAGRPYHSLTDFWQRTGNPSDITERLALAGAFDALYGIEAPTAVRRRGRITRRDLLLAVADLERADRAHVRAHGRARGLSAPRPAETGGDPREQGPAPGADRQAGRTARRFSCRSTSPRPGRSVADEKIPAFAGMTKRASWSSTSRGRRPAPPTGLAELSDSERLSAELEIIGLDAQQAPAHRLPAVPGRHRRHLHRRPAQPAQPRRGADRRGEGCHPDAAGALRTTGGLSHRRRLHRPG